MKKRKFSEPIRHLKEFSDIAQYIEDPETKFLTDAEEKLGYGRTKINKITHSVSESLGLEPDEIPFFRHGKISARVSRAAMTHRKFEVAMQQYIDDLNFGNHYPICAGGAYSGLLIHEFIRKYQKKSNAIATSVRSADYETKLQFCEIDLVISAEKLEHLPGSFEQTELVPWNTVLVCSAKLEKSSSKLPILEWDRGSFGNRLNKEIKKYMKEMGEEFIPAKERASNFLAGKEHIRRNLEVRMAIPDIYVDKNDETLYCSAPFNQKQHSLVAIYRKSEREKLKLFIDPAKWQNL
ncbi:MAG: hypothetical protein GKR91_19885 [Pseudomonadales bacterium]|nr:hypothetical protein [Pseudomonadales bacterium]